LPPGLDIVAFVESDGRPLTESQVVPAESRQLTLADFCDRSLATHRDSLEERTIDGINLHLKHLIAALGERFPIGELKLSDLQSYVDRRAKAKGMGGQRLSAATSDGEDGAAIGSFPRTERAEARAQGFLRCTADGYKLRCGCCWALPGSSVRKYSRQMPINQKASPNFQEQDSLHRIQNLAEIGGEILRVS
jgi:hypothetical protein